MWLIIPIPKTGISPVFIDPCYYMQFTETQKFRQWWIWVIMIATLCFPAIAIYKEYKSFDFMVYLIGIGVPLLIFILMMFVLRLETSVDERGVHYRFFPFHITTRLKTWDEIDKAYVRVYKPIVEYGGWGIRFGFGNGMALNVSGNVGLQIEYKTGKKLLLGTNKREELEVFMNELYKKGLVKDMDDNSNIKDRY